MEFQNYEQMVKFYLSTDNATVFGNQSPAHAEFVISEFLNSAKESIDILSGSLCKEFYNPKIIKILEEKSKNLIGYVRIITVDKNDPEIKGLSSDKIKYIRAIYNGESPLNHFLVVDKKRYRLENIHEPIMNGQTPPEVKAEVCCNGIDKAIFLSNIFDQVWSILEEKKNFKKKK